MKNFTRELDKTVEPNESRNEINGLQVIFIPEFLYVGDYLNNLKASLNEVIAFSKASDLSKKMRKNKNYKVKVNFI